MSDIHSAARQGDLAAVKLFCSPSVAEAVKAIDKLSRTALHMASWAGKTEVVAFLLEQGAEIDAGAVDGITPLYFAAQVRQPHARDIRPRQY